MAYEIKIRDYLADHLECLGGELLLVQKEYPLENQLGAKGYIDILARDKYGMYVIIEIKRSEQASRQALHELHKYVALFQAQTGTNAANIRCIIVSTVWHELLVPFSEYCFSSTHSVEGIEITVNEEGVITNAQKIVPVRNENAWKICPRHKIYFFSDENSVRDAVVEYKSGLKSLGLHDYCILELKYTGKNKYITPYAIYIAITVLDDSDKKIFTRKFEIDLDYVDMNESPYYVEENVLAQDYRFISHNGVEIGYPEKFLMMLKEWSIVEIHRYGKILSSALAVNNADLVALLTGIEGGNILYYHSFSTTRHKRHWDMTKHNSLLALYGNSTWQAGLEWFYGMLQDDYDVSIDLFNPQNIIGNIYKSAKEKNDSSFPSMEIISKSKDKSFIFIGLLTSNSPPVSNNIDKMSTGV